MRCRSVLAACYEWSPGIGVGAGGALIVGVKRFPPVGLIDFSVGVTDVVVVEVDGSGVFSLSPQDAVRPTIATIAAPPATAARRRARRRELMCRCPNYPRVANA
jgi:hypothetical protein